MADKLGDDTLIVIPANNERAYIAPVVREACEIARNVLVVDDGSIDGTAELARMSGAQTLVLNQPQGQGGAVWSGLLHARSSGFEYVITLDADGAHLSSDAPSIYSELKAGAEVVVGSRLLDRMRSNGMPTAKVAANRFGTTVLNRVLNRQLTDVASGMRGLAGRALELDFSVRDFAFAFEVLAVAVERELAMVEVPIGVRYDAAEPHFTAQREILDFFRFVKGLCQRRGLDTEKVTDLERLLESGAFVVVGLDDQDYYFHPVVAGWYLVQLQDPWFKAHGAGFDPVRVEMAIGQGRG